MSLAFNIHSLRIYSVSTLQQALARHEGYMVVGNPEKGTALMRSMVELGCQTSSITKHTIIGSCLSAVSEKYKLLRRVSQSI